MTCRAMANWAGKSAIANINVYLIVLGLFHMRRLTENVYKILLGKAEN